MQSNAVPPMTGFAARVMELLGKIEYRRLESTADLDAVLRLRYTAYLKEGAIEASEEERFADRFEDLDNVVNVGIFLQSKLVGAVRLYILERPEQTSPAFDAFPELLPPLLAKGKRVIDPNRFVVDYEAARIHPELAYATIRTVVMASAHYDTHLVTAAVRAEHRAFYKRAFFAQTICEPREYPTLSKKISLMLVDYESDRERIIERGPYFLSTKEERAALFLPRSISVAKGNTLHSAAA
jgi:N-acyl-L-homoserine lactone synthetase